MTRASEIYGNHSFGASKATQESLLARWEAYLTPNFLAVTQGSTGRSIFSARPDAPSSFEQGFLNGNFWGQLPQIVVDSRYGFTIGNPSRFGPGTYPDERFYHGQEMFNWVHNGLLVKAGFEFDHNADAISQLRNQTGTYYYSNVASFISDALAFQKFGFAGALDPRNPHNCGATNTKFGSQPCYSYYSQTMGPTDWHLSTNDWASYITAQWQANKLAVFSAGLRWEREQLPPPIAALANPDLPLTEKIPSLGNHWGPRLSLAVGKDRSIWPVLRLGFGMYFGRLQNATIESALTQTGSLRGDLSFFMRPSDDCQHCSGGAPPFPYVFAGQPASAVKPGAVEFAPNFRNSEVHQAVVAIEQTLPSRIELTASAMVSLGRRLPVAVDTNFDPAVNPGTITYAVKDPTGRGPIKTTEITVPFYASWPSAYSNTGTAGRLNSNYQQVSEITGRANSTYEAAMLRIARDGRRGPERACPLHLRSRHGLESQRDQARWQAATYSIQPILGFEYGTGNLDVRHIPQLRQSSLNRHGSCAIFAGRLGNGMDALRHWTVSHPRSALYHASDRFTAGRVHYKRYSHCRLGTGNERLRGDSRVYGVGRNMFRYPEVWKADLRLARNASIWVKCASCSCWPRASISSTTKT